MGPVRSPSDWPASTPGSSQPPPRAGGPDKEIRMITHRLFARVMPAVLVRDGLDVKSWADLNRKEVTIAVTQGTTIDAHVTKVAPNATILRFPSNAETMAAFQSGRADAASMFHPPMVILSQKVGKGH